MSNSIFGSNNLNYSLNPFSNSTNQALLEEQLAQSYARLDALRKQYSESLPQLQNNNQATVFTDISNELKDLSEDELQFITNSKEYQSVSSKYQTEFSQFLINKFSSEYLQTGNSRTLEEMLFTIKNQKDKYREKFATDINEIRDQNKTLLDKNNQLAESNQNLKKELEEIKNRLWKGEGL